MKVTVNDVLDHKLEKDPNSKFGGPKSGETVGTFVEGMSGILDNYSSLRRLNNILESCGIKQITIEGGE